MKVHEIKVYEFEVGDMVTVPLSFHGDTRRGKVAILGLTTLLEIA